MQDTFSSAALRLDGFRFTPERDSFDAIVNRFGLAPLIAHCENEGGLRGIREYMLASAMKLSPLIAPRLFDLLHEARTKLNYADPIDLFVLPDSALNASAVYSLDNSPHLVCLTSALIERMNDAELRFVLGHEIGHIRFRHYRGKLVELVMGRDKDGDSRMPNLLKRRLENWQRLSEFSADRCGFAAVDGQMAPIVSSFFKAASGLGPERLRFDISAFLQQLQELQSLDRRDSICGFSHPATPVRVRALQLFNGIGGAAAVASEIASVDREVSHIAGLMELAPSEPGEVHLRDFLLAAGVLVGYADECFSAEEKNVLIEILLPLTSDPEVEIDALDSAAKARALLEKSAAWLRDNAGEERFRAYRFLTHVASVDGTLRGNEEPVLIEMAALLGIPAAAARQVLYESLSMFLQAKTDTGSAAHHFSLAA